MKEDKNKREVIANNNDIKRQVTRILLDKTGIQKLKELRDQELFYRAIGR